MNPFLSAMQKPLNGMEIDQNMQQSIPPMFMGQLPQQMQPSFDMYGQQNAGLKQALMRGLYGRY